MYESPSSTSADVPLTVLRTSINGTCSAAQPFTACETSEPASAKAVVVHTVAASYEKAIVILVVIPQSIFNTL